MSEENILRQKAREWALKVKEVIDTPVPPSLQAEKNALIKFAVKVKSIVEKIFGSMDELAPIKNELGVIPVIIGAVVLGSAAAAITKWTYDYNKFKTKITEMKRLQESGMSAEQAAAVIRTTYTEPGFLGNLTNKLPLLILLGGGLYLFSRSRG